MGGFIRAFKSLLLSLPWNIKGVVYDKGGKAHGPYNEDNKDNEEEDVGNKVAGDGEQTATLDAAEAYMARIESFFTVEAADGDDHYQC